MNDSSEPVETSSTRTPLTGSSRSSRASSSSTATAVRLSLAPGTTVRVPMSKNASALPAASVSPIWRSGRTPVSAPSAASAGPAATSRIICGDVCWRSYQRGNVSAMSRVSSGRKMSPPLAASWWATNTSVSRALRIAGGAGHVPGRAVAQRAAEDVRAAADVVDDPGCGEQAQRGGAAPAQARQHAGGRHAARAAAASSRPRAPPRRPPRRPAPASSPRIHSAARRSPSDAEGRSKEARCSTVARRRAMSTGIAPAG